jgi:hypothetical protein
LFVWVWGFFGGGGVLCVGACVIMSELVSMRTRAHTGVYVKAHTTP